MISTTKVKVENFHSHIHIVKKSYNKVVIDFNFCRLEDLSTLKSDIHPRLAASVNYRCFR